MRTIILASALIFATPALADVGFLVSQTVSGLNRICTYRSATGMVSITIPAAQVCPTQIRV